MIKIKVLIGYVGRIITTLGVAMLFCSFYSLYLNEEDALNLFGIASFTIIVGLVVGKIFYQKASLNYKEGFALVGLGWIVACFFGSLPYVSTWSIPNYADALFETASGFSTTGATILSDIESMPKGILLWRSLTQWLGGIGIIAFFVAIVSDFGNRASQIFRAETTGAEKDKISPRVKDNARALWKMYLLLTVLNILLLKMCGMNLFDAICHAFTTISTGGFSTQNLSFAEFNPMIQWVTIFFMFVGGTKLSLLYLALKDRSPKIYFRNREFNVYFIIYTISILLVTINLAFTGHGISLREAAFQVVSIGTTTGYASIDYNYWPEFGKSILFIAMFIGACSGSTSGNIKIGRYLIIFKRIKIEFNKMIHPQAVYSLKIGNKSVSDAVVFNVLVFFALWVLFLLLGTIVLSSLPDIKLMSAFSACLACLGNVGPGFDQIGPMSNFGFLNDTAKYILSALMIVGRLEIYPIILLFMPSFWKRE